MNTVPNIGVEVNNPSSLAMHKGRKRQKTARKAYLHKIPQVSASDQLPIDIELLLSQRLERMLQ